MYYNIHDLVKIQINGDFKLKPLDMEFEYFRTDEDIIPDIVVNIGNFKPSNDKCFLIDNEYYVKEYYFYHKDMDWEVEIEGFEKGNTIVNYNEHMFTKFKYPSCPLTDHIILPIIQSMLLKKGYYLTHCAGIGNILIVGHPHSFKTTIAMRLAQMKFVCLGEKEKYDIFGDDYVILKGKNMLSFPRFPSVFQYRVENKYTEDLNLFDKVRIRLSKGEYNVRDKSKIKKVVFLERVNYNCFDVINITHNEARKRIIKNQELEDAYSMFSRYKTIYKSIFPTKEIKPRISRIPSILIMFSEDNIDKVVKYVDGLL